MNESFNESHEAAMAKAQEILLDMYRANRSIAQPWYSIFTLVYTFLIGTAFGANTLVFFSVIRRKEIWSARNIFILNLTLADMLLCVTMTFSAVDVLTKYWPFGHDSLYLCRTVKAAPCFVVYMTSLTIVVIAFDRYWCIVRANSRQLSPVQAIAILLALILTSLLMSTPIYNNSHLHVPAALQSSSDNEGQKGSNSQEESQEESADVTIDFDIPWSEIVFCIEDWNMQGNGSTSLIHSNNQRHLYSIFSLVCQFGIPLTIISVLYMLIYSYLQKNRIVRKEKISDRKRARRTNTMLFIISLFFCLCWLPLNGLSLVIDSTDLFEDKHELMLIVFIICHVIGMSSACINPILYGYRNEGVRNEISGIFKRFSSRHSSTIGRRRPRNLIEMRLHHQNQNNNNSPEIIVEQHQPDCSHSTDQPSELNDVVSDHEMSNSGATASIRYCSTICPEFMRSPSINSVPESDRSSKRHMIFKKRPTKVSSFDESFFGRPIPSLKVSYI